MNQTETLLWAIERLRPELPALVGADWPEFNAQLAAYLRRLETETDPVQRAIVPALIVRLFERYPRARRRLAELMGEPAQIYRGGAMGVTKGAASPAAVTLTRYTDIVCPRRVWVATPRISVVVRLTVARPEFSAAVQELELDPAQPVRVSLQAPGFTVLGLPVQPVAIPLDADSAPVVFDLRPEKVGHTSLTFDFWQGSELAGTVAVAVEVTAYEVAEGAEPRPGHPLAFQQEVAHPDMVLHIAVEESPAALVFSLIRDGGAWWKTFPPVRIALPPEAYTAELYRSIASLVDAMDPVVNAVLGKRLRIPPEDVDRSLRKLGQNLWKSLIPDELKALYAAERGAWADKTLLIFSDEPHLPWELVWPYDEEGRWRDETPWCCTLNLTRWLRKDARGNGNETPPGRLQLGSLAVLAPSYSLLPNLPGAQMEQDVMLGLVVQHGLRDASPAQPAWSAVMDLLEGGNYDWIHAAAHGNFYAQAPDTDSALWLEQDRALTPDVIVGPEIEAHLRRRRPGFFFNACQVGRQSWTLTRIGGWANRLISAGAGLFVGPLWEVSDGGALTFASTFYRALFDGETVAKAARQGRVAARAAGDPTWLAYSVYAHPNARVVVNGER